MALDTDRIMDRRRLKRRLGVWRVVAVLALVALVAVAVNRFGSGLGGLGIGNHIAVLHVEDVIISDVDRLAEIRTSAAAGQAKALLVNINSPGGTVAGGEALFRTLRAVAEKKPVVAVIGELGTSAGYMTALGADHIIARQGSITGSIGVILQSTDVTGLLDKLGIKPEAVKSSPLKAQPNPLEPFTEEAREATQAAVNDVYEMFVDMVAERRGMDRARAAALSDGRIYTGGQALSAGLIDDLGGEAEAMHWLASVHGIDRDLPLKTIGASREVGVLRDLLDGIVGKTLFSERLRLDGLISLWHPELQ